MLETSPRQSRSLLRRAQDRAALSLTSACMQRGIRDRFYVSPKAIYALRKTYQLQIHRCWPKAKKRLMTFPEQQG